MNKNYILLFLLSPFTFGQVGINTDDPQATMEIKATNPTGSSTSNDGLIIPNLTRQRAQNMDNPSESTLIYISDITNGTASGKAIDIDEKGYYYYNGTKWVKLTTWDNINGPTHTFINAIAHDQTTNLVKLGGHLMEPTTIITDEENTFALTGLPIGSTTDNLVVKDPTTGVLKEIAQNSLITEPWQVAETTDKATLNTQHIYQMGKIGIGTSTPKSPLHIRANLSLNDDQITQNTLTDGPITGHLAGSYNNIILALNNTTATDFASHLNSTIVQSGTSKLKNLYGSKNVVSLNSNSPSVGNLIGFYNVIHDRSGHDKYSTAAYFQNNQNGSRTNTENNTFGTVSSLNINPQNGATNLAYNYAASASASGTAENGDVSVTGLRGTSSYVSSTASSGRTFKAGSDVIGVYSQNLVEPNEGTINTFSLGGITSDLYLQGKGSIIIGRQIAGEINDGAQAINANIRIQGDSNKSISNLYGYRLVSNFSGANVNILTGAYGMYLPSFIVPGNAEKSWNIYSDGINTKNYFAGKVGIGTATPTQALDIVGKTKITDANSTAESPALDVTGKIKIADGTQDTDKILTSDENGVASWKASRIGEKIRGEFLTDELNTLSNNTKTLVAKLSLTKGTYYIDYRIQTNNRFIADGYLFYNLECSESSECLNIESPDEVIEGSSLHGIFIDVNGVYAKNYILTIDNDKTIYLKFFNREAQPNFSKPKILMNHSEVTTQDISYQLFDFNQNNINLSNFSYFKATRLSN